MEIGGRLVEWIHEYDSGLTPCGKSKPSRSRLEIEGHHAMTRRKGASILDLKQ
jgi:hypothetical protein